MKNIGCYDTYGQPREHPTLIETDGGGSPYDRPAYDFAYKSTARVNTHQLARHGKNIVSSSKTVTKYMFVSPRTLQVFVRISECWFKSFKMLDLEQLSRNQRNVCLRWTDEIHILKCARMTLKACKRPHKHLLSS